MKWIRGDLLGSGSYGLVYKAKSVESDQVVVIKEIPSELISKREVNIVASFSHPHVIRYVAHEMVGNNLWLILEYAEYGNLANYIDSCHTPLPEDKIIFMMSQMISGLDYLHQRRIMHRDLKPSNILLICPDVVKLADFGTSKCIDVSESSSLPVGTLCYMAPEIYNGSNWSFASDIWSLGCIVYFMAERVKPFRADAAGPLILSIVSQRAVPIGQLYSRELANIVLAMMNTNETNRPSTYDLISHPLLACTIHSLPVIVSQKLASHSLNYSFQQFLQNRLHLDNL